MKSFFCALVALATLSYVSRGYTQSALCKQVEESYKNQCANPPFGKPVQVRTEVRYVDNKLIVDCYRTWPDGKSYVAHYGPSPCNETTPPPPTQPVAPPLPEEIPVTETEPAIDNSGCQAGSIILTDNLVLGETVPVVGANFELAYFSNKVLGRKGDYKLKIPLTLASYSSKLTHVKYSVKIDGKVVETKTLVIAPNLSVDYIWNGINVGKNIGSVLAEVIVEKLPNGGASSFSVAIGSLQAKNLGFGGWVPTNYHFYDINRKQVLRGDGSSLSAPAEILSGNQLRVVDSDRSLIYIFDTSTGKHLVTKSFWLGTNLLVFNYDEKGLLASVSEPFEKRTIFNRDSTGDLRAITASNGQVTQITLDANKYLSSVTSPSGKTHSFSYYETNGLLKTFQKPQGQVSTFRYDSSGSLVQDSHSGGYAISLDKSVDTEKTTIISSSQMGRATTYFINTLLVPNEDTGKEDKFYQRVEVTPDEQVRTSASSSDANLLIVDGVSYYTKYDNDGRFKDFAKTIQFKAVSGPTYLVSSEREESFVLTDPKNPFSIKSYNLTQTDQNGEKTITNYDGVTRTFVTQTNRGVRVTTKIDTYERPISVQFGNDLPKIFTYTNEKLTRISQGNRFIDYTYDANSKLLSSVKNAVGQLVQYFYNGAGQLQSKIYPDLKSVVYDFDENEKMIGIVPAESSKHNFEFNALELLTSYSPPAVDGEQTPTVYDYNADKQLQSIAKPDGTSIVYNYEQEKGILESVETSEGVYTYDFNSDRGTYDKIRTPRNIVTSKQIQQGGFVERDISLRGTATLSVYAAETNERGLVARDFVQGLVDGGVSWVDYSTDNDGKIAVAGIEQISYDPISGRIISSLINDGPNYVSEQYGYNQYGELNSYTAKTNSGMLYSLTLEYDNSGRIVKKVEIIKGISSAYEYGYDLRNRLIEVKQNGSIVSTYKYDGNGNRIAGTVNGQAIVASYDAQDRLKQYNSEVFQYNLNGELLSKKNSVSTQETPMSFNSFGYLTSVKVGSSSFSYEIDGLGRRIQNFVNGKLQGTLVYSGQQRLVGVLGADGKLLQRYVYATKSHVPDYIYTKDDAFRIITDHLGSVRLVIRVSDGAVVHEMLHDEFGRVLKSTAPSLQPFGFAGGLYDHNTGLVQFGARWYDPQVGRWISKDPIKFEGGDNLYSYVLNNPVNLIDSSGLSPLAISNEGAGHASAGGGGGAVAPLIFKELAELFQEREKRDWPLGPPDGSVKLPNGDERFYDKDGVPTRDEDWSHDHGHGVPHVHDWIPQPGSPAPKRGPARPPKDGECK